ncbi:phosphatidylinositol-3,5-bisphosphate 5-phosphatase [Rhodotorula paludigena]|uniref:phosphatidylinositol-3,5-bisphosphate 5-phosphatase n=1 Tax=Rhodotorula paludigena TaxID=86838 RepID=UPI0031765D0F
MQPDAAGAARNASPSRQRSPPRLPPSPRSSLASSSSLNNLYASLDPPFDAVPALSAYAHDDDERGAVPPRPRLSLSTGRAGSPRRAVTSPVVSSPTKRDRLNSIKSDSGAPPSASSTPFSPSAEKLFASTEAKEARPQRLDPAKEPPRPEEGVMLERMTLYETRTKLYVIATDRDAKRFRVLKIDRTPAVRPQPGQSAPNEVDEETGLTITEDATVYTLRQKEELLETLRAGNGGLKLVEKPCFGIAGFVRFTSAYHMILITKRQKVAVLGGHFIFHSEATDLHEITPVPTGLAAEDARQKNAFLSAHLSRNFYFSYTYDVTNTLQRNLLRGSSALALEDKWVWNWHLLRPMRRCLRPQSPWILPLIHGFVEQRKLAVFGRTVYIALIARRSRHFAGARFLRRGVNDEGFVANDVESEQIVAEALTTPFYTSSSTSHPHPSLPPTPPLPPTFPSEHQSRRPSPRYTSHVQCRGSIPLYWSQDVARGLKPPIEMAVRDPYYAAAAKHFDGLLRAYGGSVVVLNLIKHGDKRESTLLPEFKECVDYLNQFLPDERKIDYITFDMSAANTGPNKNALGVLEDYAEGSLEKTGFFHSGGEAPRRLVSHDEREPRPYRTGPTLQEGVVRTNCIDCLDRTNAAQTMIAMIALGHQLHALGLTPSTRLEFESDACKLLETMYREHGDCIAVQYGGSNTVNTIDSYRPTGPAWPAWSGGYSRDKVENVKRYYANSFGDYDKQAAIDLFLGIKPPLPLPPSWEYLPPPSRRSYRDWYTPSHLSPKPSPEAVAAQLQDTVDAEDELDPNALWRRYYRGKVWQTFDLQFQAVMPNSLAAIRQPATDETLLSPFLPRRPLSHSTSLQRRHNPGGLRGWISHRQPHDRARQSRHLSSADPSSHAADTSGSTDADTGAAASTTPSAPFSLATGQLAAAHLQPSVRADEAREYEAWTTQFRHLSLASLEHLSEKDRAMYIAHAATAAARTRADAVSERDKAVYAAFERAGRPRGAGGGGLGDAGVSSAAVKMYREMIEGVAP